MEHLVWVQDEAGAHALPASSDNQTDTHGTNSITPTPDTRRKGVVQLISRFSQSLP